MNPIKKYRQMSFEQKTLLITITGLCASAVLAVGKLVVGLIADYDLCVIAIYTFAILLAKLECVLGIKSQKRTFKTRNVLVAVFLFVSSILYSGFMLRMFFVERKIKEYSFAYTVSLAFISFAELGFAIAGILRTKHKGHYFRNIKIINFAIALIAILTTQMTILDYMSTANTDKFNACTGMGVGVFIALCALYIAVAPKISIIDRERNVFALKDPSKNNLTCANVTSVKITLKKSFVYGAYVYSARVENGLVDGTIGRDKSLWNRMHVTLKILCCILSEILLPMWLIGRFIFFLRSVNILKKLEKKMNQNGFERIEVLPFSE